MNIDGLKKKKATKVAEKKQEDLNISTLQYNRQRNAIDEIKGTEWFKIIKEFWQLQRTQAQDNLDDVRFADLQELWRVQAKSNISKKFISFLDNLES